MLYWLGSVCTYLTLNCLITSFFCRLSDNIAVPFPPLYYLTLPTSFETSPTGNIYRGCHRNGGEINPQRDHRAFQFQNDGEKVDGLCLDESQRAHWDL